MVDLKLQMAQLRLLSVLQPSQRASLRTKFFKGSVFHQDVHFLDLLVVCPCL